MQDREFDDLFRSKLEGFEAEPTERVWTGIDGGLDTEKRRRIFVPLLRIAASVVILLPTGLFFITHKEEIKTVKRQNNVAQNSTPVVKKSDVIVPAKQIEPTQMVKRPEATESIAQVVAHKRSETPAVINTALIIKEMPEPLKPLVPQQEVLANVTTPAEAIKKTEPEINVQPIVKDEPVSITTPQSKPQAIAQVPVQQPAAKPAKRHGIHNMGDLVNLVVAKVDKRKEKLIQFSDTDDDESNLTAVNIGPIKLNREDKGDR